MISSTIGELASERQAIERAITAAGLTDGWLFEFHASASGQSPESRYLDIARNCDVYVVVVAGQGSPATEAEYHEAFVDNPRKVLPFFLGPATSETDDFRRLIESRHLRVHRSDRSDLVTAVVDAVTYQVESGELVRPGLIELVDTRLRWAEAVVRGDLPLAFIPFVTSQDSDEAECTVPASALLDSEPHLVLEGIGGSGKSYAALAMLRHAAGRSRLPIVVQASSGVHALDTLIAGALEEVRFFPGESLLAQLARDGALTVAVDGIDGLASDDRRLLLEDVDRFVRRYPRSQVVCCLRRSLPGELPQFTRRSLDPLSASQTTDLFEAVEAQEVRDFPPQVADLARWPLWAWALVEVGPGASTGLVLLQQLLERRVRSSGSYTPIEELLLTEAAAVIAYEAWPQPSTSALDALSTLARWRESESVSGRFTAPAAEVLVQRLSAAGIIQLVPEVAFAHPLFATYLAASHAARSAMSSDMRSDPEFSMFVAALLDESRSLEIRELLVDHGPVGQARYLRLVPEAARVPGDSDAMDFGMEVQALTGSPAQLCVADDWAAWIGSDSLGRATENDVESWLRNGLEVTFLPGSVLSTRKPIDLAAMESLNRFKATVLRLAPDEDRFRRLPDRELRAFRRLPRAELDELVLEAVMDWRNEWHRQVTALRLEALPGVGLPAGDPQVSVYERWPNPRLRIEWGVGPGVVWLEPVDDLEAMRGQPLSEFLEPGRNARVYHQLVDRAEREIGCRFGSQSWSRPELVAAWAW